jgi:hypothetical protein
MKENASKTDKPCHHAGRSQDDATRLRTMQRVGALSASRRECFPAHPRTMCLRRSRGSHNGTRPSRHDRNPSAKLRRLCQDERDELSTWYRRHYPKLTGDGTGEA